MADERSFAARLAAERGPGIARAHASTKLSSKLRAASALRFALTDLRWTQRGAADYLGVDEKVIREWLDAGQQPAWIPLALPRRGYTAYLEKLFEEAPPPSMTGTDGY
jgi:hypothetical protein